MKTGRTQSVLLCGALLLAFGVAAGTYRGADAMPSGTLTEEEALQGCRDTGQPKMLIVVFHGTPDTAGVVAADTLRNEVAVRACRQYFPIAKGDIEFQLNQSGYSSTTPLQPADVKTLGGLMGADVVVMGRAVNNNNRQWTVTPIIMSTFQERITETLEPSTAIRVTQASRSAMMTLREVGRMLPHYRECEIAERNREHDSAVRAAKAALEIYPNSTMARVCLASAYLNLNLPPDSVLALTGYVLDKNPRDYFAIRFTERAERLKGNTERANDLLAELLSLNATDVALQEEVINRFAEQANYGRALQIVAEAKSANPGQPEILSLEATICLATSDFPCAIRAYEDLAVVDTAAMTVENFQRLARAYRETGQTREAAQAAGRGATKFDADPDMQLIHSQLLREAGDTVGSIVAARRALAIDPENVDTYLQIAAAYPWTSVDSVLSILAAAVPHLKERDDTARVFNFSFANGQSAYNVNDGIADSLKDMNAFKTVIRYMEFSQKLVDTPETKFYQGLGHFYLGYNAVGAIDAVKDTDPAKGCELAREAFMRLGRMQELMNAGGGSVSREAVGQMMQYAMQAQPYVGEVRTALCR